MSIKIINQPSDRILLAISGGVDSVVLLDLLLKMPIKKLVLAHVNHNLRGADSDLDELFVKKLAYKYQLEFYSTKLIKPPKNENEGRVARYNFLAEVKAKTNTNYIALAHHKNDQIETLLLQLVRGTAGFSPMGNIHNDKWRPLLDYNKKDILAYAQTNNLSWREDLSNYDSKFTRNLIRQQIIPALLKTNPKFNDNFLNFTNYIHQHVEFWQEQANNFLHNSADNLLTINRQNWLELPILLQKAIVKTIRSELSSKHITEILEMINKGQGNKQKHEVLLKQGQIYWHKNQEKIIKTNQSQIILASNSPQRKKLLATMGYNFLVMPSTYNEKWDKNKSASDNIQYFAEQKAINVWHKVKKNNESYLIIGCDTFVVHPQYGIYLKPIDANDAKKMLISYSNNIIEVWSGLSVLKNTTNKIDKYEIKTCLVKTKIDFAKISLPEIDWLISRNEWQNRSGGTSIEGGIMKFVKKIDGCFYNIIGLPTQVLTEMINHFF